MMQRPALLGFTRDGTQVLALARKLDTAAMATAKDGPDGQKPQLN